MKPGSPRVRTLDVRPVLAAGGSPFEKILAASQDLAEGESLLLITPFLPSPIIETLQSEGFQARTERRADGGWQTHFTAGGVK
jgi:hypothetical protein